MRLDVNVPNFGPGTNPDVLRRWALTVEGLGFDLLMMSDHIAVTPDVAQEYPAPFYEPFTTLSWLAGWLAGATRRIRLGTFGDGVAGACDRGRALEPARIKDIDPERS